MIPRTLSCYASALMKAFPLDMSQYHRLFNTTRIPVFKGTDELVTHDRNCHHIIVMRNGHMYTVQAIQDDGMSTCINQHPEMRTPLYTVELLYSNHLK